MRTFAHKPKATRRATSSAARRRDRADGQGNEASSLLQLQRAAGNRAVRRLLEATRSCEGDSTTGTIPSGLHLEVARIPVAAALIQRKPAISSPGDRFEREADDVADRVMRMAEPTPISSAPASSQPVPLVAVQGIEGGEEEPGLISGVGEDESGTIPEAAVQRKAESGSAAPLISPVADELARTQSGGEPLGSGTRRSMEAAFGRDFSRVRVHRDGEAAELSHQLSALAFTHGSHIYFGSGKYDPEGSSGKHLLAHELTHVAQQGHATPKSGAAASTAPALQSAPPAIQRAANWAAPAVHQTNNLADTALNGVPVGVTFLVVNGAAFGAVNAPTVTVTALPGGMFAATVTTVPVNAASADETVLAPGPWRRGAPRATIGALFGLAQCTGAGNSNFRARGDPSDDAMFAANRRHEDHHAADGHAAFNATVVPWDARLTAANAAGTAFPGATDAAARAALFAAMGGTPVQIRNNLVAAWNAAIVAFHGTPAGGPVGAPTDPTAETDCSWSFARYHNPG